MTEELRRLMVELQAGGVLVTYGLDDDTDGKTDEGLVIAVSPEVVVFQLVNHTLDLDGYAAVRLSSICWAEESEHSAARLRVLERRAQSAHPIAFPVATMLAVLQRLASTGQLVSVSDDDPDIAWVGVLQHAADGAALISLVTPSGIRDGVVTVPTTNISVVEWGNRYLDAVLIMLEMSPENQTDD